MKSYAQMSLVPVLLSSPLPLLAGDLVPPAAPTDAGSAMNTIENIYNRLDGTDASALTGGFNDPTGGTGKTLTEVYNKADATMKKIGVPKTGQTKCYDLSSHSEKTCAVEDKGQDGNFAATVGTSASPRFTASNGTVTDNLTGLIWLENANCFDSTKKTWAEVLTFVSTLAAGTDVCTSEPKNLSDGSSAGQWRLPNVKELLSLIDLSQKNSALPSDHPLSGVPSNDYWSSTIFALNTGYALFAFLVNSDVNIDSESFSYYVLPVRGWTIDDLTL